MPSDPDPFATHASICNVASPTWRGFPPGIALSVLCNSASSERVRPSAGELDERQLAPHMPGSTLRSSKFA
jgi:hypothetical protein